MIGHGDPEKGKSKLAFGPRSPTNDDHTGAEHAAQLNLPGRRELVEPIPKRRERGCLARTFCVDEYVSSDLETRYSQHNPSHSRLPGTVRGLHVQRDPHAGAKVVDASGRDLRRGHRPAGGPVVPSSMGRLRSYGAEPTAAPCPNGVGPRVAQPARRRGGRLPDIGHRCAGCRGRVGVCLISVSRVTRDHDVGPRIGLPGPRPYPGPAGSTQPCLVPRGCRACAALRPTS